MKIPIKKISFVFSLFIWSFQISNAQQSINASGKDVSGSRGVVSYLVGQVIYQTHTETNGSVAEGVQQPYKYPPKAEFTASPTSGTTPLTVQFQDQSETGSAPITNWSWDFGDGGTSISPNPQYTYSLAGNYTVSLTATNQLGVILK